MRDDWRMKVQRQFQSDESRMEDYVHGTTSHPGPNPNLSQTNSLTLLPPSPTSLPPSPSRLRNSSPFPSPPPTRSKATSSHLPSRTSHSPVTSLALDASHSTSPPTSRLSSSPLRETTCAAFLQGSLKSCTAPDRSESGEGKTTSHWAAACERAEN